MKLLHRLRSATKHSGRSTKNAERSAVAGVVDKEGGLRVVIGPRWDMHNHLANEHEKIFIVPGFWVTEPVPWNEIPAVVARTERHVLKANIRENPCGGCNVCCVLPYIAELNKPSNSICQNCHLGLGCKSHRVRPQVCKDFACDWLASQKSPNPMPRGLRPDRCGVMFTPDTTDGENDLFEMHVDHWTKEARDYVQAEEAKGRRAKLVTFYRGERK